MASVRLTKDLKNRITQEIKNVFVPRLEAAKKMLAEDFGERAYRSFYKDHLTAFAKMPNSWFSHYSNEFYFKLSVLDFENESQLHEYKGVAYLLNKRPMPEGSNSYRNEHEITDEALRLEYKVYADNIVKLEKERSEFENKALDVIENFTTLKQLLEAWPAAEKFVPDWALTDMKRKASRSATEKVEVPDMLNESILKNSILESALN